MKELPERSQPLVTINVHIDALTTVVVDSDSWSLNIGDLFDEGVVVSLYFGTTDAMGLDTIENHLVPKLHELADRIRRKQHPMVLHVGGKEPSEDRSTKD